MSTTMQQVRRYKGPALFSFGFRPFFLAGAIVAAAIPVVTAVSLSGGPLVAETYGALAFHAHEMLFGYLSAVVAGFLLTAVANWTGRLPIVGSGLSAIVALWLAGRIAVAAVDVIGVHAAAIVDMAFLVAFAAFIWREVLTGRNWRNLPVCILLTLFAAANGAWHAGVVFNGDGGLGLRIGVAVIVVLLALIGGRVTPSFTSNWLKKSGHAGVDAKPDALDKAALASVGAAAVVWVAAPTSMAAGVLLLAAAALILARLARWRGWRTFAEPLVAILHVGYLWVSIGLALLGWSVLAPAALPASTALHGLTAGAAGVMTLAVMTRATLGHTGRALTADRATSLIYLLVNLGAALRLAAPVMPVDYTAAIALASALWSAAFVVFAVVYGRYLTTARLRAKP